MQYRYHIIELFSLIWALPLLFSCNQSGKTQSINSTVDSDTIIIPIEDLYLPDTAYESAKVVKYKVEIPDSDSSSLYIKNLESKYQDDDIRTFRKNPMRNADFDGKITGTPTSFEVAWKFDTYYDNRITSHGSWGGGNGWTGQPLYKKSTNEIIISSLCSKVYFLDFNTGKETRQSMETHNPIKGTASLDMDFDNLYVGQGIPAERPFGAMVFDLKQMINSQFIPEDSKALRHWGAYDSSPIIIDDFLFWAGENGSIYKYKRQQGKIIPASILRYTINGAAPGIENSLCVYRNYAFFGDNHGNIVCINLNTMKPVWRYFNHDDIDATIVCEEENGTPYIYCGCEVDKQGNEGISHFVKLNALNGQLIWDLKTPCNRVAIGTKTLDGGYYGSPLLGKGNCKNLIFANICRNGAENTRKEGGEFIAIDKTTGEIVYTASLLRFAWSSPVGFVNEKDEMYIFTGDSQGTGYLIEAKTGKIIYKKIVLYNFEASPIVIGNAIVVGSRQNGIYKLVIK